MKVFYHLVVGYYDRGGAELWFELTPSQIGEAGAGELKVIEARKAED